MQLHIVGTNVAVEHLQAKQELASILEYLGVNAVVEEQFSGTRGAGVVLVPPADTTGIDPSCPVLMLDINNDLRPESIGVKRADGISPVGLIRTPLRHEQLSSALRVIRTHAALQRGPRTRDLPLSHAGVVAQLPGEHPILDSLRASIASTADQAGCVLISGEAGTGKRKIAEAIYKCSEYSSGPFVPVSCATFPEALLAIELFGCESGALPGATSRRIGRIEMAEGGVLLLEDIEALSVQSQASLLAFMRSKLLERVGSIRGAPCDVRVLASSSVDLAVLVERNQFREDLFYALQELVVNVPPLRNYITALPNMLSEMNAVFQTGVLTAEAWKVLDRHSWPGNVAELANFASQMAPLVGDGIIDVGDLPVRLLGEVVVQGDSTDAAGFDQEMSLPVNGLDLKSYLGSLERKLITQALEDTGFIVARAADRLQIRRTTLVEKMRKYGLQRG